MTDRILDISEQPARLRVRQEQLLVEPHDGQAVSIPLVDLAVLVVSHPQVTYTQAVLSGLVAHGAAFIACDQRHLPVGMLLPLEAHYVQTERFALQARASLPARKQLWKQIVRAKVRAQGNLLQELYGSDHGLRAMAARVRSGDAQNIEAQASRRYWPALFGDLSFRRNPDLDDQNRLLNYAYAVLRAVVARAICAAGLHPSLGLHHHNRYNPFCLADDLMEPFRPLADKAVLALVTTESPQAPLDRRTKALLLGAFTGRLTVEGESRTLFDVAARTASSLVAVLRKERSQLVLPEP